MQRLFYPFLQLVFILFFSLLGSFCFADNSSNSLYNTSIQWRLGMVYAPLLEAAPKWPRDVISQIFSIYKNLPFTNKSDDENQLQYNIHFINYFWGPVNNPFNKYPRPIKVFVFLYKRNKPADNLALKFFMAPLIKDTSDNNFYVFDRQASKPILLNDWINQIRAQHGYTMGMRLNVCSAYADYPNDSCSDKSYANETNDSHRGINQLYAAPKSQPLTAKRAANDNWKNFIPARVKYTHGDVSADIYEESVAWDKQTERNNLLQKVDTWANYPTIKDNFEKIRDLRYFADAKDKHFSRRISWLYPDDGCWTRGAAVIKDFFGPFKNQINKYPRPAKVFAFGNLCANTPNSKSGRVTWWYHTAPIIRDAQTNQTYVLDPSVNPYEPMATEKWMATISSNSGACAGLSQKSKVELFNVCNGYGVNPNQTCKNSFHEQDTPEAYAALNQRTFQTLEKSRQIELGRDPDKVLGNEPPWVN